MSTQLDADVIAALDSFIRSAGVADRAMLIGGQALRDWGAREAFVFSAHHAPMALPMLRATTDIDVHLALEQDDAAVVAAALVADWDADTRQSFRFHWKRNASVTLDLVTTEDTQAGKRVKTLAKIGTGGRIIGAARVFPRWVMDVPLVEPCHTPAFALLGITRLSHLGLLASKLAAVNAVVDAHVRACRPGGVLEPWVVAEDRLAKDLGDIQTLLDLTWVNRIWSPLIRAQREMAERHLRVAIEAFCSLRDRPASMPMTAFQSIRHLGPALERVVRL